jgi:GGDEF domain-containing protein
VADALRHQIRAGDVAARLGGDQFAALLTDTTCASNGAVWLALSSPSVAEPSGSSNLGRRQRQVPGFGGSAQGADPITLASVISSTIALTQATVICQIRTTRSEPIRR